MLLVKTKRIALLNLDENKFAIYETGLNKYNDKGFIYIHFFKLVLIIQVKGLV